MTFNNTPHNEIINLAELTSRMKYEDQDTAAKYKRLKYIYWILIPLYMIMIIRHITDGSSISDILGSIFFMLSMLIFAIFFTFIQRSLNRIDYSLPTLELLKKAKTRYSPFQYKKLWVVLAIVLIDAGLTLNSALQFGFLNVQMYFGGAIVLATGIGLMVWRSKYQKLRTDIVALIKEIEQGN